MDFLTWVLENQAHVTFGLIVVVAAIAFFLDKHIRGDKVLHKQLQQSVEDLHKCIDDNQKETRQEIKDLRRESKDGRKHIYDRLDTYNTRLSRLEGHDDVKHPPSS